MNKQRSDLSKLIPLQTPFSVIIEPTNHCNFKCVFCPTGDHELLKRFNVPRGYMEMGLYRKIIDSIRHFLDESGGRLKTLLLYKDGEPLLHRGFPEMVSYAKDARIADEIWTTTNGALLNPGLVDKLIDSGLDGIRISVEALTVEGYQELSGVRIDYDDFLHNISYLHEHKANMKVLAKMIDAGLTMDEKDIFTKIFGPITDECYFESYSGWSLSGVKDFTPNYDVSKILKNRGWDKKDVCASPFYSLAVNFNGSASACCVDWSHGVIVGDLKSKSFGDVWNGANLFELRELHLLKQRSKKPACAVCTYMETHPDYLDDHAEEIYQRLLMQPKSD